MLTINWSIEIQFGNISIFENLNRTFVSLGKVKYKEEWYQI